MENLNKEKRVPIETIEGKNIFPYTRGTFNFFCKTCVIILHMIIAFFAKQKKTTKDFELLASKCIWIVYHKTLKLAGIASISTSVLDNCFCRARMKIKDCICKYCYAANQQSYQTGLKEHNILNGFILRNVLIPVSCWKKLTILFPYLRIESFGDVENLTQARNYIRIIKANPEKRCAIWSKNIMIWKQAFELEGKPRNTTYIHSSSKLNCQENMTSYSFVDHVFTVFTKKYAKEHNITINCGGKKCMECILAKKNCYFRLSAKNNTYYINELKK